MKIALVQTNPVIGAFDRNVRQIRHWLGKARQAGCELILFPELALCGYPPGGLLERAGFLTAHDRALADLIKHLDEGITCVLGVPERLRKATGKRLANTALVVERNRVVAWTRKQHLATYAAFDESRYFEPGVTATVFSYRGRHFGLTVGEDLWGEGGRAARRSLQDVILGSIVPDCLLNISALPYWYGSTQERLRVARAFCAPNRLPLLEVNQAGAQGELLFAGHSLALDPSGDVLRMGAGFIEDMVVVETELWDRPGVTPAFKAEKAEGPDDILAGLAAGIRDYARKTGFTQAVLGLSGGIDSALVAVIACRALGPENVVGVALPSPYTADASLEDARELAANLGCAFQKIDIAPLMDAFQNSLAPLFAGLVEDVTEQNLQARIRGALLMALANKHNRLLLNTSNRSELAMGYSTLYGDLCGSLAVLADVPKTTVYALSRYINRDRVVIPERTLTRSPTAELRPDQCDQDDLPPYEVLDEVLRAYLDRNQGVQQIIEGGANEELVRSLVRRINRSDYKRRQSPPGLMITRHLSGDRRNLPLVHGFEA
ncbi:MAG: NAD+ synthase [Desulfobulbus sp.]